MRILVRALALLLLGTSVPTSIFAQAPAPAPDPARRLADSLFAAGSWSAAAQRYAELVRRDSTAIVLWMRLGIANHRLERYSEAAAAYERAVAAGAGAMMMYNAASAHARLAGAKGAGAVDAAHADKAFDWLGRMTKANPPVSPDLLKGDADFTAVRGDARLAPILDSMHRRFYPCEHDERARKFDFWIGDWDVRTTQGQAAGANRIERIIGGCALLENWTAGNGSTGKSMNAFNQQTGQWQQYWVGQAGGVTEYRESEWKDGALVYLARGKQPDGTPLLMRMTFTPMSADLVRQHGEQSTDDGKTWTTTWDLMYHRKK